MQLTQEDFNSIVRHSPVFIWKSSRNGDIDYYSDSWFAYTGRSPEEDLGEGWKDIIHPDDLEHVTDVYVSHFKARKPCDLQYRLLRHDGKYRWILEKTRADFDASNQFTGYYGFCFDIDENKKAELQLKEAKEQAERDRPLPEHIAENFPNSFISVIEDDYTIGFSSGQEFRNQGLKPEDYF